MWEFLSKLIGEGGAITVITIIIAIIIAGVIGLLKYLEHCYRKNLMYLEHITPYRLEWTEKTRDSISKFITLYLDEKADDRELIKARCEIELLLSDETVHSELSDCLDKCVSISSKEPNEKLNNLIKASQKTLYESWKRVKEDAGNKKSR